MFSMGPVRGQPVGLVPVVIRLRGAGAAAPVIEVGPLGKPTVASATSGFSGATITRAATGDYTLTLNSEPPGVFQIMTTGHGTSTPSATTVRSLDYEEDTAFVFATTPRSIRLFHVTPATDTVAAAASDMASTDVWGIVLWFRSVGTNPT